jgi:hypothetical protein
VHLKVYNLNHEFIEVFYIYKILVTAAITFIKGGINCVKMKNTNVIKYKMHNDSYSIYQ